jgi:diguanylate cyclase (GGDEF)-like protein
VGRAVIFVDIDGLKSVNDELGHSAGDRLLAAAAGQIRSTLRDSDFVGRLGGDEFLVICPRVVDAKLAMEIAERISAALMSHVDIGTHTVELRTSIGVAWTEEPLDTGALIAQADHAMYESKRSLDRRVTWFADAR